MFRPVKQASDERTVNRGLDGTGAIAKVQAITDARIEEVVEGVFWKVLKAWGPWGLLALGGGEAIRRKIGGRNGKGQIDGGLLPGTAPPPVH